MEYQSQFEGPHEGDNKHQWLVVVVQDLTLFYARVRSPILIRLLVNASWHPEYGRYMLEGTPGEPYMGLPRDLLAVERNMKLRYEISLVFILRKRSDR